MILLIMGTTHTGKTFLAQRLLERYHFPYLSIDHLKMGLIRSHNSALTPESSEEALTAELWPIVREMIKTNIENHQNLIVEGCYIPFSWRDDFEEEYRREIRDFCIIFSRKYIEKHFPDILAFENVVENRMPSDFSQTAEEFAEENRRNLEHCREYGVHYHMVEDTYDISLEQVLCCGERKENGLRRDRAVRRKEREITDAAALERMIESCDCCRLGLWDGSCPYIVPLNFGFQREGEDWIFYFHSAKEGKKLDLIRMYPQAGFEMDTSHELKVHETACGHSFFYQSVMGKGEISFVEDEEEKKQALRSIMEHYTGQKKWAFSQDMLDAVVILKLRAEKVTGKEHR